MKKRPERLRLLSAAWLATVVLLTPGCSIWQVGDVAPNYVDASTHRGVDVLAFDAESRTLASGGWDGTRGEIRVYGRINILGGEEADADARSARPSDDPAAVRIDHLQNRGVRVFFSRAHQI